MVRVRVRVRVVVRVRVRVGVRVTLPPICSPGSRWLVLKEVWLRKLG